MKCRTTVLNTTTTSVNWSHTPARSKCLDSRWGPRLKWGWLSLCVATVDLAPTSQRTRTRLEPSPLCCGRTPHGSQISVERMLRTGNLLSGSTAWWANLWNMFWRNMEQMADGGSKQQCSCQIKWEEILTAMGMLYWLKEAMKKAQYKGRWSQGALAWFPKTSRSTSWSWHVRYHCWVSAKTGKYLLVL